jgi:hypothetical protein
MNACYAYAALWCLLTGNKATTQCRRYISSHTATSIEHLASTTPIMLNYDSVAPCRAVRCSSCRLARSPAPRWWQRPK